MNTAIDHLVVVAHDLAQGVAWCESTLGVTPAPGGKHPLMGTHNRLVGLDGQRSYLEIIAIDPDAPPPGRSRWFGMDRLADTVRDTPRLVHVVVRSTNLDMHRWGLVAAGCNPGTTLSAQRETPHGLLRWRISVRADGVRLAGGALPALIEWQGAHPADAMDAPQLTLAALEVAGLDDATWAALAPRNVQRRRDAPPLRAVFDSPNGRVTLDATSS